MEGIARFLVIALLVAGTSAFDNPTPHKTILNEDLHIEEVGKGVWRHISYKVLPDFGRSPANGLIVISGKDAVIIDTPWSPEQTRDLIDWVEVDRGARIRAAVVTHSHGDCLGGLEVVHNRGAVSYSLGRTAELAEANGKEVPRITFESSREIEVGSRRLKLHYPGGGHTEDNIVVWIPDERILFGGCLVKSAASKHLGYTKEAVFEEWPGTIRSLMNEYRDARIIVPGHGSPGGDELLTHTLELIEGRQATPPGGSE